MKIAGKAAFQGAVRAATSTEPAADTVFDTGFDGADASLTRTLRGLFERGQRAEAGETIRATLIEHVAAVLGATAASIDPDESFFDIGMDSLLAFELRGKIGAALGGEPPAAWFLDGPSVAALAAKLIAWLSESTGEGHVGGVERVGPGGMYLTEFGDGERVVFVHGGAFGGLDAWQTQLPLADRRRLIMVSRLNYGRSAPRKHEDYTEDGRLIAELLGDGAHIVAQSYGTLGALVAAAQRPAAVRSLTLIESAASHVAREHPAVADYERAMRTLTAAPPADPAELFRAFFNVIEPTARYPEPLPASLHAFAASLQDGMWWPWEAELPLAAVRAAAIPTLVVSGGGRPVFEAISDALAAALHGERLVIPGGHGTQNTGTPFNEALADFLDRAERR
jgi:pimeloyl-ACP methyl ester carboxylesterase/acyl carrier protein